jgi:hypothetical protein
MDLGTQNILVDDRFNFRAIIDWEFAQTAPWQVNHYPMTFPLLESDTKIQGILQDPNHPVSQKGPFLLPKTDSRWNARFRHMEWPCQNDRVGMATPDKGMRMPGA